MKKILTIFTGGTISCTNNDVMQSESDNNYRLLEMYKELKTAKADLEFESLDFFSKLSENFVLEDILNLAKALEKALRGRFDGIIITHGSDTLNYTAAFLAHFFADAPIPIVLTAANKPLEDETSDGIFNFSSAINFIYEYENGGVFVAYKSAENADSCDIFTGLEINEADIFTDNYSSIYGCSFGKIKNGKFSLNRTDKSETAANSFDISEKVEQIKFNKHNILILKSYVGLNFETIDITKISAVLLISYHSGTFCTGADEEDYNIQNFIKRCEKQGVKVFLMPHKTSEKEYASQILLPKSAVFIKNLSISAAYAALVIYFSSGIYLKSFGFNRFNTFNINENKEVTE